MHQTIVTAGASTNQALARMVRTLCRHYGLLQIGVVLGAVAIYELLRLTLQPDWPLSLRHAHEIAGWEQSAHLGWEAPIQHVFLRVPLLVEGMNVFYLVSQFLLTGCFFLWLYHRSRSGYCRFRDAFLISTAIALIIVWRFPTAPPRLAGLGIEDTLRRLSGLDIGSRGAAGLSDPVAAVPSLHAGWALGVGIGLFMHARSTGAKILAVLYPVSVLLTIVVTGNHFLFDGLVGFALLAASLGIAEAVAGTTLIGLVQRRGVEQSGSSPGS